MDAPRAAKLRGRGRPRKAIQGQVIQDLMTAAEFVLADKSAKEITLYDIASAADVDETMIHYYFGGKDGLMIALLDEIMKDAPYKRGESIMHDCIDEKSIKPLIQQLLMYYYPRWGVTRMAVEMASSSPKFRSAYIARYFDITPIFIGNVVKNMIDSGVYDRKFDGSFVTTTICSLVWGPFIFSLSTAVRNLDEKVGYAQKIEDLSRIVDVAFKPSV
jgi:AcrR family transcriptional regulator